MAEPKHSTRKSPLSKAVNRAWRRLPAPRLGPNPLAASAQCTKAVEAWAEVMRDVDVRDTDDAAGFLLGVMQETFEVAARAIAGLLDTVGHPPDGDGELNAWFAEYNVRYFAARLPAVPVDWAVLDWMRDSSPLGVLYHSHLRYFGPVILLSPTLAVGTREFQDTLLHEMVHLKLDAEGGDNGRPHAPAFQAEMSRLSEQHAPVSARMH